MRKHRKHFDDDTDVDMTPMLDIVFIMLIFFIVTTSFTKEDGIVLDRPTNQPDQPDPPKTRPILIAINDNSEISMGGRLIDINAVRANVETARAKKPNALVVVQAHESAKIDAVVRSVDQARLAGAERVTVVKPPK